MGTPWKSGKLEMSKWSKRQWTAKESFLVLTGSCSFKIAVNHSHQIKANISLSREKCLHFWPQIFSIIFENYADHIAFFQFFVCTMLFLPPENSAHTISMAKNLFPFPLYLVNPIHPQDSIWLHFLEEAFLLPTTSTPFLEVLMVLQTFPLKNVEN